MCRRVVFFLSIGCTLAGAANAAVRGANPNFPAPTIVEQARVAKAPNVPPPIDRKVPAKVVLNIEVKEHTKTLADGVTYTYWTFGDDTPGLFIRVREGDVIETHFSNHPDNTLAHNVDFHAATGPGGGGEASFIAPGHQVTFTWRALAPGLYLYHCVAAPAGLHIANGMYGLFLVEPKEGLPKVDREYFLIQGEFYTQGAYGERGFQQFSMTKALNERPEYVVFNGHVGAVMGENALKVKTGESVRFYLGNAGPSLISSFHIVGEVFDKVYGEGGTRANQVNVQTTLIPVGGSAMADFVAEVPGAYELVDHSMFRAFNRGAMGTLVVTGPPRHEIFSDIQSQSLYNPGTHLDRAPVAVAQELTPAVVPSVDRTPPKDHGEQVYTTLCITCHQPDGRGLPNAFPPLAQSDFLQADPDRAVRVLLQGLSGEITVNGQKFNGTMPKFPLTPDDIASALTYVRSHFGNDGAAISVGDVNRIRASLDSKRTSTTAAVR
jgi:nitrite reductase (NO-forming)